jgi:hypothetical protein
MLNAMSTWFAAAPRRMVQAGLWTFFAGAAALLSGVLAALALAGPGAGAATLAERYPALPTWFVPESPIGFTAASMLVCWGVWAMASGLRIARGDAAAQD